MTTEPRNLTEPQVTDDQPITGEVIEISDDQSLSSRTADERLQNGARSASSNSKLYLRYFFLPILFLTVALLGGLRVATLYGAFVFVKPPLLCLIFAAILMILCVRAKLIVFDGWFNENFQTLTNVANVAVLVSLFAASIQLFNSLLPERGLPFWIVGFCFFWTLWTNLFADFDTKRLLRSLGALFGVAFIAKYLILANLTAPAGQSWLQAIIENPAQGAFTWLLDLPRFSATTGYIQFFTVVLYLFGLFLLPQRISDNE
ncbi:MAG: hypothetical protein LC730_05455 [Acidobacteria bacterium]|nr:hypothetical protein [Acidobacteriota bacterium]MCA1608889.1 hypothetical protein [Acidobacteriota bacterium]